MKILIGCSAPPDSFGGGIATYTRELSEALVDLGNVLHLLSPKPRDRSWLECHNIKHVISDPLGNPTLSGRSLVRYLDEHSIDGCINNDNPVLQSIAPELSCPLVVVGHYSSTTIASLACYQRQWSDYIVAISYDMQATFVRDFDVPIERCPLIMNGVRDPGVYAEKKIERDKHLRMLFVGGSQRSKGADLIVALTKASSLSWRDLRLDWYGSVTKADTRAVRSNPNVRLHGRVPRDVLQSEMCGADVLLFPSRFEGCPMAMLEAMSMGVVPIASDGIGAMRWMIAGGREGYICQLKRWPSQAASVIGHLVDNRRALINMRRAVRKRFLDDFQIARVAQGILELLKTPTVNRSRPMESSKALHWHRPVARTGGRGPLLDRLRYRLGILREVREQSDA